MCLRGWCGGQGEAQDGELRWLDGCESDDDVDAVVVDIDLGGGGAVAADKVCLIGAEADEESLAKEGEEIAADAGLDVGPEGLGVGLGVGPIEVLEDVGLDGGGEAGQGQVVDGGWWCEEAGVRGGHGGCPRRVWKKTGCGGGIAGVARRRSRA